MNKKSGDISVNTLEELVKTHGNQIVTGYVRFKKIRSCNGFDDARDKAAVRLSKVTGGRKLENETYAAVISFRWIIFLCFLLLAFFLVGLWKARVKALERKPAITETREVETETNPIETIEEITEEESRGNYSETMDVQGFRDISLNENLKKITLFNPENNKCSLGYKMYIGNNCIYTLEGLAPGESEAANLYDLLPKGIYGIKIITTGYDLSGNRLNSVSQTIKVTIEK